jgi:putative oligomerization/nucleic acid binding protein
MSLNQAVPKQYAEESHLSIIVSRACSIPEVQPHLGAGLKRVMWRDEAVLACYQSYSTLEGASFEVNVISPRRVIQARSREKGVLATLFSRAPREVKVVSLKLEDVKEVRQASPRMEVQQVILSGALARPLTCSFGNLDDAQTFAGIVRGAIERINPVAANPADTVSLADELEKLAKLYEANSLTAEEFAAAKRKLLGAG